MEKQFLDTFKQLLLVTIVEDVRREPILDLIVSNKAVVSSKVSAVELLSSSDFKAKKMNKPKIQH